jgi:hypothetical protein
LWLLSAGDLIGFSTTKILTLKATVYLLTWNGLRPSPQQNTVHVPQQTNTQDGNYQCKIYTVPKLRALTKSFKTYARPEALIMVVIKIPVLEHAL